MNLLNLPGHVLEKIIYQCIDPDNNSSNLVNLIQCNKFLKNFIETSSRLMSQLVLKIDVNEEQDLDQFEMILDACLSSSRLYKNVEFSCSDEGMLRKFEKELQAFHDKNSYSIRTIDYRFYLESEVFAIKILKNIQKMKNVEEVAIDIDTSFAPEKVKIEESNFDLHRKDLMAYEKLKSLKYFSYGDVEGVFPELINLYKNCRKIDTLELLFVKDTKFDIVNLLLRNCSESLKKFEFNCSDIEPSTFFKSIDTSFLDLTFVHCRIEKWETNETFDDLSNFLESQKNLEEFRMSSDVKLNFIKRMGESLGHLKKLKRFHCYIEITDSHLHQDYNWQAWNITQLETIELDVCASVLHHQIVEKIFDLPSDNLQTLIMQNCDLGGKVLEKKIVMNYRMLTSLQLGVFTPCINHESDDIFLVLKHLKNLEDFDFTFPISSKLDSVNFYTN